MDGELGTIEEIRLTHVVMTIWDERRLIIPTARLLDQSFQNWSKHGAAKLGTVEIYVDYRTPVAAERSGPASGRARRAGGMEGWTARPGWRPDGARLLRGVTPHRDIQPWCNVGALIGRDAPP